MTPSYIESPTASPTSPHTTMRPFCIMKPVRKPALPPMRRVPPFMDMPARAPAFRPTMISPPRMVAATDAPASFVTVILPLIRFSPSAQPALPSICHLGSVHERCAIVPDASLDGDLAGLQDAHGYVVARLRIENRDLVRRVGGVLDLAVYLGRREVLRVYTDHVRTSFSWGSPRSSSSSVKTLRNAISSDATATTSSVCMVTSGFAAQRSLATPMPFLVETR